MGLLNDFLKGKHIVEKENVCDVEFQQKDSGQVIGELQKMEEVVEVDKPLQKNLQTNEFEQIINQLGDAIQRELYENIERGMGETRSVLSKKMDSMQNALAAMLEAFQMTAIKQTELNLSIQSMKDEFLKVIEQQEVTIQKQHNASLKFQEDVIYKTQKNLVMELISISDNVRMILHNKEMDSEYDLLEGVRELEQWVDASLKNNSIRRFQDTDLDNTVFNRKRQELVDKEETDVSSEDGTYRTVSPGYVWSMPYLVVNSDVQFDKILKENDAPVTFSYVIRPEEVVKLKYNKDLKIEE